jgi:hypothetical protein
MVPATPHIHPLVPCHYYSMPTPGKVAFYTLQRNHLEARTSRPVTLRNQQLHMSTHSRAHHPSHSPSSLVKAHASQPPAPPAQSTTAAASARQRSSTRKVSPTESHHMAHRLLQEGSARVQATSSPPVSLGRAVGANPSHSRLELTTAAVPAPVSRPTTTATTATAQSKTPAFLTRLKDTPVPCRSP